VHGERAPAAADVEQPLTRLQAELGAHELALDVLGLLERLRAAREDGARVRHRLVEEEREVVVADVVVVADRAAVARDAVAAALRTQLRRGRPRRAHEPGGAQRRPGQAQLRARVQRGRAPRVEQLEHGVDVVDVERARDVCAADAELAGSAQRVRERLGRPDAERRADDAVGGLQRRAVPELDAERPLAQRALELGTQGCRCFEGHGPKPRRWD
jgi:hypothetical protein